MFGEVIRFGVDVFRGSLVRVQIKTYTQSYDALLQRFSESPEKQIDFP